MASQNCPNVVATGHCTDLSCKLTHNILVCELCNYIAPDPELYNVHLASKKHHSKVSGTSATSFCWICQKNVTGGTRGWSQHASGQKHANAAAIKGVSPNIEPEQGSVTANENFCSICQIGVRVEYWTRHLQAPKHLQTERYKKYKTAVEAAEMDKNGISVEGVFDFDFVDPRNSVVQSNMQDTALFSSAQEYFAYGFPLRSFNVTIEGGARNISARPIVMRITFKQEHIGRYEDRLELLFEDTQIGKQFIILRTLEAIVGNKTEHEALEPKSPYVFKPRRNRQAEKKTIEGVAPPFLNAIRYVGTLPRAEIPHGLLSILS